MQPANTLKSARFALGRAGLALIALCALTASCTQLTCLRVYPPLEEIERSELEDAYLILADQEHMEDLEAAIKAGSPSEIDASGNRLVSMEDGTTKPLLFKMFLTLPEGPTVAAGPGEPLPMAWRREKVGTSRDWKLVERNDRIELHLPTKRVLDGEKTELAAALITIWKDDPVYVVEVLDKAELRAHRIFDLSIGRKDIKLKQSRKR